jgi:probable phosphoglycerate mutase
MVRRILLARHGESVWNAAGRWQGQADPRLSDLGRVQAHAATAELRDIDAIVTSPLQRASETAAIIAGALDLPEVVVDDDLKERDAGEWSGLTRAQIEEAYPGWLESRADAHVGFAGQADSDGRRRPPGWETDERVLTRALAALRRIADLPAEGDVLVVTHGGLVYTVERHLGAPFGRLANLAGRWLARDGSANGAPRWQLGERVCLIDADAVRVTIPDQL